MSTTLEILAGATSGIRWILIGGHALQELGVPRQTMDVDCLLAEKDRDAFDTLIRKLGWREMAHTENFTRYADPSGRQAEVDTLLVDGATMTRLIENSREVALTNGSRVRVPGLADFVALKLHAMKNQPRRDARDFADVLDALRANPGKVDDADLSRICTRYGPEGVYERLKEGLR